MDTNYIYFIMQLPQKKNHYEIVSTELKHILLIYCTYYFIFFFSSELFISNRSVNTCRDYILPTKSFNKKKCNYSLYLSELCVCVKLILNYLIPHKRSFCEVKVFWIKNTSKKIIVLLYDCFYSLCRVCFLKKLDT